jgi:hypothetical protein
MMHDASAERWANQHEDGAIWAANLNTQHISDDEVRTLFTNYTCLCKKFHKLDNPDVHRTMQLHRIPEDPWNSTVS